MRPSVWHIVAIVIALIVLFGWRRLPDMARSVGQSMKVFKKEVTSSDDDDDTNPGPPPALNPPPGAAGAAPTDASQAEAPQPNPAAQPQHDQAQQSAPRGDEPGR